MQIFKNWDLAAVNYREIGTPELKKTRYLPAFFLAADQARFAAAVFFRAFAERFLCLRYLIPCADPDNPRNARRAFLFSSLAALTPSLLSEGRPRWMRDRLPWADD